jgi:High potential iron-sulfur protein
MSQTNRRVFLMQVAACGSVLTAGAAQAQAAKVDEKDPQAVALGYVADTTKADKKKFPKHANDQKCNNCALYQGKATDAAAGCRHQAGCRYRLVQRLGQERLMTPHSVGPS